MAVLRRSSQRMSGSIWPGFVDAMTALLLVLMFVLTIFMVVQSMLRETISGQETELNALTSEVEALARALGLEQQRAFGLEDQLGTIRATLSEVRETATAQTALIAALQTQNAEKEAQIASFEAQVASLLSERDTALALSDEQFATIAELESANARIISEQEALQLALARAREEIDVATENARLAAARREALDALVAQLQTDAANKDAALAAASTRADGAVEALNEAEKNRILDQAALHALRDKLATSQDELTALTLALEEERKSAEETLTLLAAAEAARRSLDLDVQSQVSEAEKQAALLATAKAALADESEKSAESERKVSLLNQQVSALRSQLASLQAILDDRTERDAEANVQIDALTSRLNSALAQVAAEERRRAQLEEAERKRLEDEAKQLQNYRSEFFGRLREILGDRDGVRIVGDRFVFSSEVLFDQGSATLATNGQTQIARVARILSEVSQDIPAEIDWVIRVDGHTDKVPLSGTGDYKDNWELSQARALSVVRYMTDALGFPGSRLAAAGFGEFHPIASGDSPADLAQNRRIELKLTEK
ncbi:MULTISPECIES: peptidoglycan -binding protein [Pacificibacter]|uniref:peptidoglycan -binding protein n=1 Tax=Pacificibacter TaxID=1042323 RepID=UPI001C08DA74|nr:MULTISPECIES: peptidoglycan -binding protein [Pacificibacter]MBU2934752.1 peptidoglycan -binding protein [Pacificibacter marinus]MDO6615726.1 peptidoglycan -binding protein [Pacificibacter sp. 1_MG-2023]